MTRFSHAGPYAASCGKHTMPVIRTKEDTMPNITVKGMHCEHCRKSVADAVAKLPGVASVEVDLATGRMEWTNKDPDAPVPMETIRKAIIAVGFEA